MTNFLPASSRLRIRRTLAALEMVLAIGTIAALVIVLILALIEEITWSFE